VAFSPADDRPRHRRHATHADDQHRGAELSAAATTRPFRRVAGRLGAALLLVVVGVVVPYLVAEGIYSCLHRTSLTYDRYLYWFGDHTPQDPRVAMITDAREITSLFDLMRANGVGLGNGPFAPLTNDAAAINREESGCLIQKPNLRKTMSYLRSNLFNPFDQITYFYDTGRALPPEITSLFARYGVREVHLTTNEYGERLTLPVVQAEDAVLVADPALPYGTPEQLVPRIIELQRRESIERVVLLYMPYIYNVVPEVTRLPGHTHRAFPTYHDEKRRLLALGRDAGFSIVDFVDVADGQRRAVGSQFAPLALYADHAHPSKLGVELLLPRLTAAR
jgi:hypothetical protein